MNCKKLIAAIAALAVSLIPVSGFAAEVNTTTTYNTESGKVEVSTAVTGATSDSEVTYIVKSAGEVVYIDQDTAEEGSVEFTYKIDKAKIAEDYSTSVKFGSSSEADTFTGNGTESLGIMALQQSETDVHYTITYPGEEEAWGYGEQVTAQIVPDDGYEVTAIYVDGVKQENLSSNMVLITYGQTITADVQEVVVDPGLSYILIDVADETGENAGLKSRIVILEPKGNVDKIGVLYKGDFYPSNSNKLSAVKIIFPAAEENYNLVGAYTVSGSDEIKKGNVTTSLSAQ